MIVAHYLKILPCYYEDVSNMVKNFEVRKNDRNFSVGDILILQEWDGQNYTGRSVARRIFYILDGRCGYLKDGYVVLGLGIVG